MNVINLPAPSIVVGHRFVTSVAKRIVIPDNAVFLHISSPQVGAYISFGDDLVNPANAVNDGVETDQHSPVVTNWRPYIDTGKGIYYRVDNTKIMTIRSFVLENYFFSFWTKDQFAQ